MIIIGIDPGTAKMGWGVINAKQQKGKKNLDCLGSGFIKTSSSLAPAERLKILYTELNRLLKKYQPNVLAVESLYFFKNLKTALPVSQAKGVVLLAAAKKKIPVYEFTPLQVKMIVTGYGRAEKKQVQKMIKVLLNLDTVPKLDDAADALGVAICYAHTLRG